jgi:hypothetical protein
MSRERSASWVLALFLAAAAVAKVVRIETSVRDLEAVVRGVGLGRASGVTLTWSVAALATVELLTAAALLSPRHRRGGLVALLGLVGCGAVVVGIASEWGARRDFGCPCGLGFDLPPFSNAFSALLLRDAALVALAALAWGPQAAATPAARVRPA